MHVELVPGAAHEVAGRALVRPLISRCHLVDLQGLPKILCLWLILGHVSSDLHPAEMRSWAENKGKKEDFELNTKSCCDASRGRAAGVHAWGLGGVFRGF